MRFKILGPLEITDDDGRPIAVSRRLHRWTLATLLLNPGQPRSPADLIAGIWGDDPPHSPDVSLRSCVYGIRKLLPEPGRLQTHAAGYLIKVHAGEFDLQIFSDLAARGRLALDTGDPAMAAELLAGALALWREPPLADLPASPDRERLFDQRTEVRDALIDATLMLGRHREVLAQLRASVTADPLREHAWAQLIVALYRSGARAEALAAFGKVRMVLVTAYGIEPGPELQDLHKKILSDDPALLITADAGKPAWPTISQTVGAGPALPGTQPLPPARPLPPAQPLQSPFPLPGQPARWHPPGQLPASVCDFTGRRAEAGALSGRLRGEGMAVTVLTGMLGAGKSALAVYSAHLARANFPDGQLYACLDEGGRPRDPQVILAELLRGLGVPAGRIPAPGSEREALYRSVLAGRRVLVLADGAFSATQARPLLPGTEGSAVLVTSRARLTGLDGAHVIEVGGMPPADAATLLASIAGRRCVIRGEKEADLDHQYPRRAALIIAAACGHLPFAVRIAGARLADDPQLSMEDLAVLLSQENGPLDQLVVGELDARARIAAAAHAAGEAAAPALALIAAAGPGDPPGSLIISFGNDPDVHTAASALIDVGLLRRVTASGHGVCARYRMHPLLRAYAAGLAPRLDPSAPSLEPALAGDCLSVR